ncbi:hypothetical protein N7486_007690 [Penicillium sp. IBT 16267x]|nr:hypothetical protein N7486_007690 [Penicillium sp. IBT 16267x]
MTVHFHPFYTHLEDVPPFEEKTLADLRALKEMWTSPDTVSLAPEAWRYQLNKCLGCILARISSKKVKLRDLRILLWSRTDDFNSLHRSMDFVDDSIGQFGHDEAEEIFATVINLAHEMKVVHRACINAASRKSDGEQRRPGMDRNPHHVDSFVGHETGRLGRYEPSPTSHRLPRFPPKADNESDEAWGDLSQQIDDMIEMYNESGQNKKLWLKDKSKRDGIVRFPTWLEIKR